MCCSLPFLRHLFPEVPLPWLMGSAVPCGGSMVEPAGTGRAQHGAAPATPHRAALHPPTASTSPGTPSTHTGDFVKMDLKP